MTDYPQWSTVKAELDDPSVSAADKNRLLNDYAQAAGYGSPFGNSWPAGHQQATNPDFVHNYDEIMRYARQYDATDAFGQAARVNGTGMFGDQLVTANQAAGQAKFADQQQRVQDDQAVGKANTDLADEAKKTVAQGGSGAATSDEILDPGAKGLLYFQQFIPPYRNWVGSAPDLTNDIQHVYDNLRGINLAKFRADAAQLATSHGKLSDITTNLSTATNSLGGFWQGPAAQAAQRYCTTFAQHGQTVADGTNAAGQLITDQLKAIETAVLQRSQAVLKMYASDIGGFTSADIQQIIDAAKMSAGDDELRSMAQWNVFSNVDWGDTNCNGSLSQNVKNLVAMDATNWLNTVFKPNFDQKKSAFDSITKSTHDTVGQSFDALNQGLGKIDPNPFHDLDNGIQVPTGGGSTGGSGGAPAPGGGGGASTTPTSALPPTTPSSASPPPTTAPPATPSPPTVPPTTVPNGTPETVTVQHGDNKLTMTGPDSQGTMRLTTQDGNGQPKTYAIDFGPAGTPANTGQVQHVTPGPNGVATIHDGKTTITAQEQPNGEVEITVNDGSGQPTTYTLDPSRPTPTAIPTGAPTQPGTGTGVPTQPAPSGTPTVASQPTTGIANTSLPTGAPAAPVVPAQPAAALPDPTVMASNAPADPAILTSATLSSADPQATALASVQPSDPSALGGAVGGGAGVAAAFHDPAGSPLSNALGGVAGGSHAAAGQLFSSAGHPGVAGTDVAPLGHPGDAGLASAPPGALDQGQSMGMPMMGGMGGMGGQGGDQQRGASPWRTYGQLFDDPAVDDVVSRFSGTLDDGR